MFFVIVEKVLVILEFLGIIEEGKVVIIDYVLVVLVFVEFILIVFDRGIEYVVGILSFMCRDNMVM